MKASCAGYARLQSGLGGTGAPLPAALTAAAALPPAALGCGREARYEARTRTGALAHVAEEADWTSSAVGTARARKRTTTLRVDRDDAPLSTTAIGACS